ncbi:phospho-N-acetylmuramoyl-pentapeptide-transferase [Nitratidesulfovibrio vulgaris]|jgi:phospho-N-acetylmuramoyl-pentapeptide-transferase|uniref:Phospho-N-acetylmuramoyl-pentapeptide-transferase n=2 Tax=Nitratidesulfovibrio vulgaris TaxID=881 RepID=MRAY_NITV2|nr:phospho-N-acetylmuramoyl-pentapeptide-transferase [Nitratidesulfovibrio vulgaris]A1VBE5.1 RecName: Full=Phospho-N-acetylmuramoyl-pentapeptide-transferase; AltName: Full=UDP-MurNAc-pentapeptide phosphotransferase [Nitratidesulfovibrio vulgaris DP4]Q728U5.1 RecName: Full=Phospho-N-acetylmuramoyl-pentapeptide-transferase; AltName: Full=UDP-MurNAc-pentapeptide phosphotransferase [Nitratidesulfovibrio vulgaris str. Hildenborough]GEB80943.1 phospho-N-acetylmuramoyl-pentapeptide-transferase [Desulfo
MLYNLLYPLSSDITVFNVFRYITFRSAWALATALLVSIVVGPRFIAWLQRLKCRQFIHEDVTCHMSKAGTPTMGGLLIGFAVTFSVLLWADLRNPYIWLTLLVFTGFGFIGFLDDYTKLRRRNNKGLTASAKFLWQVGVAVAAMYLLVQLPAYSTKLAFPFFKGLTPDLGWLYIPFAVAVMVGSSNGVNLTDGLDGLAIGPTIVAGIVFSIFIYVAGHSQIAGYLQVPYVPGVGEVAVFCGALVGAGLGFLWFNAYPAQVFMGDVGSLSLGGTLGFLAVLCKQELLLLVVGGLFVVETLSVILQVGYFKFSGGKRIFRMAPLHHHFELQGIPESKIIIRFWITSALLGLIALSVLKLR